jgi:uncharacterized protein (DUF4415 family)
MRFEERELKPYSEPVSPMELKIGVVLAAAVLLMGSVLILLATVWSTRNIMKREYDFRKAKRGAVVSVPKGKTRITIRLDDEILAWFRDQVELAGGGNYQTVINEVLRQHIQRTQEPLEKTLRRVIREEIRRAS